MRVPVEVPTTYSAHISLDESDLAAGWELDSLSASVRHNHYDYLLLPCVWASLVSHRRGRGGGPAPLVSRVMNSVCDSVSNTATQIQPVFH